MFSFDDWIRRRLASLLRPWLRLDPELELKLGFLRSHGVAKNLSLDPSILNRQLFDESSSRWSFKEFTIEELSLRVSYWSGPTFVLEVRGVNVTMSLAELKEGRGVGTRRKSADTGFEDKEKILAEFDPEGTALHEVVQKLSGINCSRNRKTSLLCDILKCCQLHMHDIHLEVQFSILNDTFGCLFEIKELNAESLYSDECFLGGLVSSLVSPVKERSFSLDVKGFEIALKRSDRMRCPICSADLFTCMKFKDLQLMDVDLKVPVLSFSNSSEELLIILAFFSLSSNESNVARSGRHLWNTVASRINTLLLTSRITLHKLVNIICLWLQYVNAYESLLLVVGYPVDNFMKRSAVKLSKDNAFSVSVKKKWKMVSEIEKKLPAVAIARARRIARCRAALNIRQAKNHSSKLVADTSFGFFRKALVLLELIWNIVCGALKSLMNLLLQIFLDDHPHIDRQGGVVSGDSCAQSCFRLSMGIISIVISPENRVQTLIDGVPFYDLRSSSLGAFSVSIDGLFLTYTENICEECFIISCGNLKVMSSFPAEDGLKNNKSYLEGHLEKKLGNSKTIVWAEPARVFHPENATTATANETEGTPFLLWNLLSEMRLNWKNSCTKFEGSKIQCSENPWFLCEVEKFVTDQTLKNLTSGFRKCSLMVGKLNFVLDYPSILSAAILLRKIQHALCLTNNRGKKVILSTPMTCEIPPAISWDTKCKSYISDMEKTIVKMLPQKHIQIAVFIAGPLIQLSLGKDGFHAERKNESHFSTPDDLQLALDIHDIELAVWPTLGSEFVASPPWQGLNDSAQEYLRFKEPQTVNIPKLHNEIYIFEGKILHSIYLKVNGLKAYLDDSAANQQYQIVFLNPITIKLSSVREDVHSFSTSIVASSADLHGTTTRLTVLLCMDKLFVLVKALVGLFSAVSCFDSGVDSYSGVQLQELTRQEMVCADFEREASPVTRTKGVSLIWTKALFVVNSKFELTSIDIILLHSQKSNDIENCVITFESVSNKKLAMQGLPDYGIWFSVQQTSLEFSCEQGEVQVIADLSEIRLAIFSDQNEIWKIFDQFQHRNLLHSLSCLYELSLSACKSALRLASLQYDLPSGGASDAAEGSTSVGKLPYVEEDSPPAIDTERSNIPGIYLGQKVGFAPNRVAPASGNWLAMSITFHEIYMTGGSVKKILVGAQKSIKLESSLSIGQEFQTIACHMQGGSIFIETSALAVFGECFASYLHCIRILLHVASSEEHVVNETGEDMAVQESHSSRGQKNTLEPMIWERLEALTVDLSQFSLVLVAADESGGLKELQFDADLHLKLELADMKRRFSVDLFRLSVVSQILHEKVGKQTDEIQNPRFSSLMPSDSSSHSVRGDHTFKFQHTDGIHSVLDDASCSSTHFCQKEPVVNNSLSGVLHISRPKYILEQLRVSIAVEKPVQREGQLLNQVWVGSGSITGFDVIISLPEVQMLLSTVESLSGVLSKETSSNVKPRHVSANQESDRSLDGTVPDGALVAIQDVHQHMYITVEGGESKYSVVGATHYSLVGDRALFRVKYQIQRIWKSSVLWFSLISLYAKRDSGEPLRLNYRSGSGFVDISSASDGGCSLWRMLSCKPNSSEGDIEPESYNFIARNTFYLVNKKIDRGVAFVDGVPEFVSKPGNPFKWKVFDYFPLARDVGLLDRYSADAARTSLQHNSQVNKEIFPGKPGNLPYVNIEVDKIILTIVHELPDTKETFPLLQASLSTAELTVQILFSKARIISTLSFVLYYFDSQSNLWRDFIHPVDICIFYRSRFQINGSELGPNRVPVQFFAKMKEFRISVTELSLDILLFVIGKLDLAGPYATKTSTILANCCKVENLSGLNLLCHFYDNQDASIAAKQSSTIVLRHLALVNQPPEASYVSVQLAERGNYLTSPIHLSLLEARSLAWRTRIKSEQDSKTYPGPFIVVDISRKREDGLSVVVSPLLRIHNETKFSIELRFRRPQQNEAQSASVVLKTGDTIDDSVAAFDAINLSGGLKKALTSLSVGNFLLSFRPEITEDLTKPKKLLSVEWSDDFKGGKAVRLSGVFDKLSYKVRKAFLVEPVRYSFGTACCSLNYEDGEVADLHFLIQSVVRNIPVVQPDNYGYAPGNKDSPLVLQEQKEIFLLPTVRVFNLLQEEIHVLLTDMEPSATIGCENIGNQATIPPGSTVDLYANPATIYFIVTLTAFNSSCKPVDSGDWVKKLQKRKDAVRHLDIDLVFCAGKYVASLRLSRGHKGMLEAAIFTSYTLRNDTDIPLFCFALNQKPLSRDEAEKLGFTIPPELGALLPPKSTKSWFIKKNKVCLKLLEEKVSAVMLDLDALSGLTEISLEVEDISGSKYIAKFGVSLGPFTSKLNVSSQRVTIVPRYVMSNESEEAIFVRQCYLEDETEGMIAINSKQKVAMKLRSGTSKREISGFEKFVRKHRNTHDDSLAFIQFRPDKAGLGWSGPVCVASLGRFFLKFKRSSGFFGQQSSQVTAHSNSSPEFAAVHVVEESSSLVLHFHKPPDINLPYRIENSLHQSFITYYQKDSMEPENLGSGSRVDYVWDDMTLPRRLVVQINGMNLLREINLDKVRAWKPFYRVSQRRGLGFHLPSGKTPGDPERSSFGESVGMQMVGYEVYADGPTRVLRFCEFSDSHNRDIVFHSNKRIRWRISSFALNLLENAKQEVDNSDPSVYTPIIVVRLENVNLDSMLTDKHKYNQIRVQSLSVDQKWVGAPFASMLRRHQSDYSDTNDDMLHVVIVLLSSSSNVKQVNYSSVVLQPLDLNLDEETLMRLVPFWRTSLSENTQSQQYYFDHFEIHPVKIIASFLPGDSYSSYSSTQEMLRSLLHSVIKIPAIKSKTVELNGVLVTHALITIRELFIKCAQHYSWYAMRAIYIAKGSSLLPPAFASIFDDSASSSLDVFFDPSSGLIHLPGLTIGTFKFISKCIDGKGFSGTKRYLGDLGKTMKTAGSNVLFAAVTEISDSVLKGAEASGLNGMVTGFHQGILKLAMEPSVLGAAFVEGGPDRKIVLDQSPGIDELYIEGYLQAMLDSVYQQEYLRVRVVDNQVFLKNLPPNSSLIEEIMDRVKGFLVSKALLKGDSSITSQPLRHRRGDTEWKIGPIVLTLCEHLFVSFAIRLLKNQASKIIAGTKLKEKFMGDDQKAVVPASNKQGQKMKLFWRWGIGRFVLSGIFAYIDGRLCRSIPHPVARRIVSGFLLSFLDKNDNE